MQNIEILLTPHLWLQLSAVVRNYLAKEFKMRRSSSPQCTVSRGMTVIQSDGHTIDDLRAMNVESMQAWLGFQTIDPEADINALFVLCARKAEQNLTPPAVENVLQEVAKNIESKPEEPKEVKPELPKPFCEHCTSKGVRHLKTCTRLLTK